MTPAAAKAAYARQFLAHGETVVLRRLSGANAGDYVVTARIMNFEPSDLAGSIQQGKRKAIVLADEVAASGFPAPFLPKQDRLIWNGKTLVIHAVDDATRRVAGVAVAYELELAGA
jgi:hypothetical protein